MPITIPAAFRQHVARFSSPVYPGETVTMDLWKDGNVISFEAKVKARNVAVIKSGKTRAGFDRHSGARAARTRNLELNNLRIPGSALRAVPE